MSSGIKEVIPSMPMAVVTKNSPEAPRELVPAVASSSYAQLPSLEQVKDAVAALNQHFSLTRSDIRFSIEKDVGMVVVSVVDSESGAVLMQLPTEQALQTAREVQRGVSADHLIKTVA